MPYLTRIWTAMAVLGAGLVHLAVAASAPVPVMIAFALVGSLEIVWAALVISRGRYLLAKATPPLLLLPSVVWAIAVFSGPTADVIPPLALGAATLLDIAAAISVAFRTRRRGTDEVAADREPRPALVIAGIAVGAILMTAVALPAVGQTAAGIAASKGPHAHHTSELELDLDHEGH